MLTHFPEVYTHHLEVELTFERSEYALFFTRFKFSQHKGCVHVHTLHVQCGA